VLHVFGCAQISYVLGIINHIKFYDTKFKDIFDKRWPYYEPYYFQQYIVEERVSYCIIMLHPYFKQPKLAGVYYFI